MRQASRRSWRIGQRLAVRVVYFAYRATLQAQALSLVARKLQASLLVEGEIGDAGLAAYGADADDLTLELARSLSGSDDVNEESLEALFAQARLAADGAQEALDARDFAPEASPRFAVIGTDGRDDDERVLVGAIADEGTQMRLL